MKNDIHSVITTTTTTMYRLITYFLSLSIATLLISCNSDETPVNTAVNSIDISIDGAQWIPDSRISDPCFSAFLVARSELDASPFYTLEAYQNREDGTDNEQSIYIQVMDVLDTGDYIIDGSNNAHFQSHARVQITENGSTSTYINSSEFPQFVFSVSEFHSREFSSLIGITGSFGGVLYNQEDASDSLIVDTSTFVIKKPNAYTFDHCE